MVVRFSKGLGGYGSALASLMTKSKKGVRKMTTVKYGADLQYEDEVAEENLEAAADFYARLADKMIKETELYLSGEFPAFEEG
jgi:hypothetical protein